MNNRRIWYFLPGLFVLVTLAVLVSSDVASAGLNTSTGQEVAQASKLSSPATPGPWVPAAAVPYPIARYGFAQQGETFYVVGGVSNGVVTSTLSRYDAATNLWTRLAPIPSPTPGEAPSAALYNSRIYVAGGNGSTALKIYNTATNSWTSGANIPLGTYGAAAAAFDGRLYVAGGTGGLGSTVLQVYNIASNTWSTGPSLPANYLLGGYTQVGRYLYLVGSYGTTPLSSSNTNGAPASLLNPLLGADAPTANSNVTMRLDMRTGTWTTGPTFTMQRADFALAYDPLRDKLFAIGGDTTGGTYFNPSAAVDELSLVGWPGNAWTASPPDLPAVTQANQAGFYTTLRAGGEIWSTGGIAGGVFQTTNQYRSTGGCIITFTDVFPTDYFYEAVRYLSCRGTISGYSDNTFRPYNNTTRGQLTKIVVLGFGLSIYTPGSPTFVDVPASHTFYAYIETAAQAGIVSGYSCGPGCLEFRPGNDVTRGQLSKIVVVAAGWPLLNPITPTFVDVPTGDPFYRYIETAYDRAIISGYSCGSGCLEFRPGNNATRGQISKIVHLAVTNP
jgi:hypothetical protein